MRKNSKDIHGDGHGFVDVSQGGPKPSRRVVEIIDMTPTWENIAGVIERLLTEGNANARQVGRAELLRMARLADLYVASQKETKNDA